VGRPLFTRELGVVSPAPDRYSIKRVVGKKVNPY
jgi:hypothetical protein